MDDDIFAFGRFVNERRIAAGLTTKAFAEKVGITAPYLVDIEKGRRAAPDKALDEIAAVLGLSFDEKAHMLDLAARTREGRAPSDITSYVLEVDMARVALRRAERFHYGEEDWKKIAEAMRPKTDSLEVDDE
ncbi:helix-turn-helix domain-containing protein [Arcanobacterium hippocoleae]|uniref:helix-turn-helix domain-containing protein n=1 Tax=Arcanobacterium hippocoleae TaxID=149017 RepID=UPI00333ED700